MSFLTQRLRLTLNICYFVHGETDRSWLTCQLHVLIRYLQVFTQCFNNVQFCTVCVHSVIKSLVRVWLCTITYLLNYVLTVSLSTNILLAALLGVCFWHFMLVGLGWHCWLGNQTCKNRRPYNLYCVGADVKPCSINQSGIYAQNYYPVH